MNIKLKSLLINWEYFFLLLLPLVLLPLVFLPENDTVGSEARPSTKFRCAYVVIIVASFWMVEAMPLAVTSLIPVVLMPLLGIQDAAKVAKNYMKETTMMFIGGMIIALAVEFCNLHRRVSLKVMTTIGCSQTRLTLGIMLTTAFLSMWISNTATTAMVIPIALAVLDEIYPQQVVQPTLRRRGKSVFREKSDADLPQLASKYKSVKKSKPTELTKFIEGEEECNAVINVEVEGPHVEEFEKKKFKKMLLFSICLSANLGGTGVITGTGSNLIFQELMKEVEVSQNGKYLDASFATWMVYNIPPMSVNVILCWLYLVVYYLGVPRKVLGRKPTEKEVLEEEKQQEKQKLTEKILKEKYDALGPMTFHEVTVVILFLMVVLLWLFRKPSFMTGWADIINVDVGDASTAVFVALLLFIIPRDPCALLGNAPHAAKVPRLLDWPYVQHSIPWGVVLLLGGGFALSDAAAYSGLSKWLGMQLGYLEVLPKEAILIIVMLLAAACTEVASNSAAVNIFLPMLISLSENMSLHPLYLTIPVTVTCSYAFLLPVACPPNALVFQGAGGDITVLEMLKVMALPNLVCLAVLFLSHLSYGNLIFNFGDYEYKSLNGTAELQNLI